MRLTRRLLLAVMVAATCGSARADYFVLRSGARLNVSAYEFLGDHYRVQMAGGSASIAADEVVSIEPEEIFVAAPRMPLMDAPYGKLILAASQKYGVDADLVFSVIAAESNFKPRAISRRGAQGLMQLLPATAVRMGVNNIFDPGDNIDGGTRYLRDLMKLYEGDLVLTLSAYNAGPAAVQRYGHMPPYNETIAYVRAIRKTYELRKSRGPAKAQSKNSASSEAIASIR